MTTERFIDICETTFSEGKIRLGPKQKEIYFDKMRRFTAEQIDAIYELILESVRQFPKIKDIYDAARELGFLATESPRFQSHEWNVTECRLCAGEGRLLVIWQLQFTEDRREQHALKHIQPYSAPESELEQNCFRSLFRCSCINGDRPTIPSAWPKWGSHIQPVRNV